MRPVQWAADAPFRLLLFVLPFPHTVAFRLSCLAVAFVIAMVLWCRDDVPPIPCKIPIVLWIAVSAASLAYAVDPAYSRDELKNEIGYALMTFAAFFVMTRHERILKGCIVALMSGAVVLCSWSLTTRFALGEWDEGAGHAGAASFATHVVTSLPFILLGLAWFKREWQRWTLVAVAGLMLVTAFFSHQRIVWPTICVQALAALWLLQRAGITRLSVRAVAGLVIAAVALSAAAFVATQSLRFHDRDALATVKGDVRLAQWTRVVDGIMQDPLTGSGFGRLAMKKDHRDLIPREATLLWHAHNIVLNYGLEMGLPGIAALLAIFLGLIFQYWKFLLVPVREVQLLGTAGIAIVLGVLLRNQVNDMFLRDMAILFWALNGALLGLGARKLRQRGATA